MADCNDAELHCISVEEKLPHYAATVGEFEEAKVGRDGKFDLLLVGFAGHSSSFGRVMGNTNQNLSRLAPCSVLSVK